MTRVVSRGIIDAPIAVVFRMISDIETFPETNPDVVSVELLAGPRSGVGTRFRETRSMKGKSLVTELQVQEFRKDERVRMVADCHGTVWDTLFHVRPLGARTELTVALHARGIRGPRGSGTR